MCPAYFTEVDGEREGGGGLFLISMRGSRVWELLFFFPHAVFLNKMYTYPMSWEIPDEEFLFVMDVQCTLCNVHGHVVIYLVRTVLGLTFIKHIGILLFLVQKSTGKRWHLSLEKHLRGRRRSSPFQEWRTE